MAVGFVVAVCNIVERTEEDTAGNCTRTAAAVEGHTVVVAGHIVERIDLWGLEWARRKFVLHWCRSGLE